MVYLVAAVRNYAAGQATGGNYRCRLSKLVLHAVYHAVYHCGRSEYRAGLHAVDGVCRNALFRRFYRDIRQQARALRERLEREVHARDDRSADVRTVLIYGDDGRGRSHIDDDDRRLVQRHSAHSARYEVARERARIVYLDVNARFYARADYHALKPRELAHRRAYRAVHLRHDRSHDSPLEVRIVHTVKREALTHFKHIVVGQIARVRRKAAAAHYCSVLDTAENDIRISDIYRQYHYLLPQCIFLPARIIRSMPAASSTLTPSSTRKFMPVRPMMIYKSMF